MRKDCERAFNPQGADLIYKGQAILAQIDSKLSKPARKFIEHAVRQIKNPFLDRSAFDAIPTTGLSISYIADLSIFDTEQRKLFVQRQKEIMDELRNFSWVWFLDHSHTTKVSGGLVAGGYDEDLDEELGETVQSMQVVVEGSVAKALIAALEYEESEAMRRENG